MKTYRSLASGIGLKGLFASKYFLTTITFLKEVDCV